MLCTVLSHRRIQLFKYFIHFILSTRGRLAVVITPDIALQLMLTPQLLEPPSVSAFKASIAGTDERCLFEVGPQTPPE